MKNDTDTIFKQQRALSVFGYSCWKETLALKCILKSKGRQLNHFLRVISCCVAVWCWCFKTVVQKQTSGSRMMTLNLTQGLMLMLKERNSDMMEKVWWMLVWCVKGWVKSPHHSAGDGFSSLFHLRFFRYNRSKHHRHKAWKWNVWMPGLVSRGAVYYDISEC